VRHQIENPVHREAGQGKERNQPEQIRHRLFVSLPWCRLRRRSTSVSAGREK
jgi:hypothetical protein